MMNLEDAGYKVKGIAEIVQALVDSPYVNAEALSLVGEALDDLADEMTEASNES